MIKLINVSGKKIDLSKDVSLNPNECISGDIEITSRIFQMINMGLVTMTDVKDEKKTDFDNESFITAGALRRKQTMENIKAGYSKPSISLDNVDMSNTTNSKTSKRNIKK